MGLCREGGVMQGEKMMFNDKEEKNKTDSYDIRTMITLMWTMMVMMAMVVVMMGGGCARREGDTRDKDSSRSCKVRPPEEGHSTPAVMLKFRNTLVKAEKYIFKQR